MWFVFVLTGLALLALGGTYLRRRLAAALTHFGVGARAVRIVRWTQLWLLFGYPVVLIFSFLTAHLVGSETAPRLDGPVGAALLALPFAWAMLVVFQALPWVLAIDLAWILVRRRRGTVAANRLRAFGVVGVLAVFAIYTPVRVLVERGDVRIRAHRVAAASPTGAPPFRIAFLADIQQDDHTDADQVGALYGLVNARRPDLILSGGDWINSGPDHIESAAATAGQLQSRLGTFSVRGDHEHFAYLDLERSVTEVERALAEHGVTMLDDEARWFEHAGQRIGVLFLNNNYIHRTDRATARQLIDSIAGADYAIVVVHQLDATIATLVADRVDLVLAAHTHGGQINPVLGVTHVNLARIETPYVDGRYQLGSTTIIVTAGVGYSIIPIRYASPGSIEIIDLAL